jgi:hypothetical protein
MKIQCTRNEWDIIKHALNSMYTLECFDDTNIICRVHEGIEAEKMILKIVGDYEN